MNSLWFYQTFVLGYKMVFMIRQKQNKKAMLKWLILPGVNSSKFW